MYSLQCNIRRPHSKRRLDICWKQITWKNHKDRCYTGSTHSPSKMNNVFPHARQSKCMRQIREMHPLKYIRSVLRHSRWNMHPHMPWKVGHFQFDHHRSLTNVVFVGIVAWGVLDWLAVIITWVIHAKLILYDESIICVLTLFVLPQWETIELISTHVYYRDETNWIWIDPAFQDKLKSIWCRKNPAKLFIPSLIQWIFIVFVSIHVILFLSSCCFTFLSIFLECLMMFAD